MIPRPPRSTLLPYTSFFRFRMSTPPLRSLLSTFHLHFMGQKCTLPIILHTHITLQDDLPVRCQPHQANTRTPYIMFTREDVDPTSPITTFHFSPSLYGSKMHFTHNFTHTYHPTSFPS